MRYDPSPHQLTALAHLERNDKAALFIVPGGQKTVVTLTHLYNLHFREAAVRRTLIVSKAQVARTTWPEEIEKWDHLSDFKYRVLSGTKEERIQDLQSDAQLFIISSSLLLWLIDYYLYDENGKKKRNATFPFDSLVLDELSTFKNRSGKTFKKLQYLLSRHKIRYVIGLTGTPSPNGYIDLWAQMFLIDGGERLSTSFDSYAGQYFTRRTNGMITFGYDPRPGSVEKIAAKIQDIALTMQAEDLTGYVLPKLHIIDKIINFAPTDQDRYDSLEKEYVLACDTGEEVTALTAADLSMKLIQLSSGAIYAKEVCGKKRGVIRLNEAKLNALEELIAENLTENFIVVYWFKHERDRIMERIPDAVDLQRGKKGAQDIAAWNRKEIRVLLIHPASAGYGLNLQFGGRSMIWFSLTWDAQLYVQTLSRLHRRGALQDVYIYRLIVKGTRDEAVAKRLESKGDAQSHLMNEIKLLRQKYLTTWDDGKN